MNTTTKSKAEFYRYGDPDEPTLTFKFTPTYEPKPLMPEAPIIPWEDVAKALITEDKPDGGPTERVDVPRFPLVYEPESGNFYWTEDVGKVKKGNVAGSYNSKIGYWQTRYKGVLYYNHRLAYLAMTGGWPEEHVDHIDSDKSNNAWKNLRAATHRQNVSYKPAPSNNTSGQKGVSWQSKERVWRATYCGKILIRTKDFDKACRVYKHHAKKDLGVFYYD